MSAYVFLVHLRSVLVPDLEVRFDLLMQISDKYTGRHLSSSASSALTSKGKQFEDTRYDMN